MFASLIIGAVASLAGATISGISALKQAKAAKTQGKIASTQRKVQGKKELGNLKLNTVLSGVEQTDTAQGIYTESVKAINRDVALIKTNAKSLADAYKLNALNAGIQVGAAGATLAGTISGMVKTANNSAANYLKSSGGATNQLQVSDFTWKEKMKLYQAGW